METNRNAFDIAALISKEKNGELTAQEKQALQHWIQASKQNQDLYNSLMQEDAGTKADLDFMAEVDVQAAWQKVAKATGQQPETKVIPMWQRLRPMLQVAAVFILLVLAVGIYRYNKGSQPEAPAVAVNNVQPAEPEEMRTLLVLQDGSSINLDSIPEGTVRELNGIQVVAADGVVRFDATAAVAPAKAVLAYNTISTPRGGQYQVVLPDGSKVWLNAASSLRFPTAFSGAERRVALTGEAYFEVVKDTKQFIVDAGEVDVTVLGTSFNVSSYDEDNTIATTLVTGHVQLSGDQLNGITNLTPGRQAVFTKAGNTMEVNKVDTEFFTVWKEGKLYFEKEELESIIKKLNRWYAVDVAFADQASKKKTFTGVAFKNRPIDHLLSMISQTTDVTFEKKGGKIYIKK
ncbi:FecR domain-containing protein [Botryobacter ruber]|uniref:FecR domain-containing protein n=1 Tax=Botryobacter ruber TaxID=2171629 RepID=UPI000E09EF13|nr:FecR domain-containing protein [Botryobacter ruber]